jgi:NitT/TauT family transport system substrate-binding protein
MIPTLRTKQIDAFIAWEPFPSKAVTLGVGEVLIPSGKIWPKHPCCVLVADTQFIKKNPEIIRRILIAHVRATRLIHQNPKEALEIGVKFTGMDIDTVKLAMKNIAYEYIPDMQGLLDYVAFLRELDQIKEVDPRDFVRNIIQKDLIEEILQQK